MRFRVISAVLAAAFFLTARAEAQTTKVCKPLRYFNASGTELVYNTSMPTPWFAVRMSPEAIADVDSAYFAFGVDRASSSGATPDTLDIRVLKDKLPQQIILDEMTLIIPPNIQGKVPDSYYVAEFAFVSPVARIDPVADFWLSWRLRGPAGDRARIRLKEPAQHPRRSVTIGATGDTTLVTDVVKMQLGLGRDDSVDLWAEARVCYPFWPPVELESFTAVYRDGMTTIEWRTATEENNMGFEILRQVPAGKAASARLWQRIGFVEGNGTTTRAQTYGFADTDPAEGLQPMGVVRYRLRQIDYDGGSTMYPVVEVRVPLRSGFRLEQNYPNPAPISTGRTAVSFHLPEEADISIALHDALGRVVRTVAEGRFSAGSHVEEITLDGLRPGMYFYRLIAGERSIVRRMSVVE